MYEIVIGLEVHAQINSKSKLFCRCDNDAFGKEPNTTVCPICMGFPGMLPSINREAIKKGAQTALALNCDILPLSSFDRKNYFYPDLPKGFQISQFLKPLSENGFVEIDVDGKPRKVGINRVHIEDDAGKLVHEGEFSFVDFNRAGSPLMEIVTEPDMRSAREARVFAENLQKILQFVGSSDADMYKGMMRFDASISMRPYGDKDLYPRTEIKNLNSFKALETALEYEIRRQERLWKEGKPQEQAITVGWRDEEGKTYFLRNKQGEEDYRYFPEPDIPPLTFTDEQVEEIRTTLPELPLQKRKRFLSEYDLNEADSLTLTSDPALADYFEKVATETKDAKKTVSFLLSVLMKYINDDHISIRESKVDEAKLIELITVVNSGDISGNTAKEILPEMYESGKTAAQLIEEKGLKQISDTGALEGICKEILDANPKIVEDFKNGKDKAFGALVGQVMGRTKGQANPKVVNEILRGLVS